MAKGARGNKNISVIGGGGVSAPIKAKTYALFHGSPNTDITEFDIDRAGENVHTDERFLFFTDSRQMADDFSYERIETSSKYIDQKGARGRVYEVDVTMSHPLDFSNLTEKDVENIKKMSHEWIDMTDDKIKTYSQHNNQLFKTSIDLNKITQYGYDGFIATMNNRGDKEYAVVSAKQARIKR